MIIGYARVSTQDQNLEMQIEALNKAGCERIFEDKISGSKVDRPGLNNMLSILRAWDAVIVWKLDRLGRSVKDLIEFVGNLEREKIQFKSLTDSIDTSTPTGRFFFHVMASFAQMERELTLERVYAGLANAREQGRVGGRPRSMTVSKLSSAQRLLDSGSSHAEVAEDLGLSLATLYRWIPADRV